MKSMKFAEVVDKKVEFYEYLLFIWYDFGIARLLEAQSDFCCLEAYNINL